MTRALNVDVGHPDVKVGTVCAEGDRVVFGAHVADEVDKREAVCIAEEMEVGQRQHGGVLAAKEVDETELGDEGLAEYSVLEPFDGFFEFPAGINVPYAGASVGHFLVLDAQALWEASGLGGETCGAHACYGGGLGQFGGDIRCAF